MKLYSRVFLTFCAALIALSAAAKPPYVKALKMPKRQRVLDKTYIFGRNQLKYNFNTNYYRPYSWWNDWTLFNAKYPAVPQKELGYGGHQAFIDDLHNCLDYGFGGFASYVYDGSLSYIARHRFIMRNMEGEPKGLVLPDLHVSRLQTYGTPSTNPAVPTFETWLDEIITLAKNSKYALKHNGKIVISSYMADAGGTPAEWKAVLAKVRAKHGDCFYFVPEVRMPLYNRRGRYVQNDGLHPDEIEELKKIYRSYVEACDGIHFAVANHLAKLDDLHYNLEFFREICVPLLAQVMAEPANKGKLFGLGVSKGYVNALANSDQLEEGTWYLRGTFEAALRANPDFIAMVEWNEANEDTHIQPTLCDGMTNLRVCRSILGLPDLYPHQNARPNMIVSMNWKRIYGEILQIELLNLPEKEWKTDYTAQLALATPAGKTRWRSQAVKFPASKRKAVSFKIASEKLAPALTLIPQLTLTYADGRTEKIGEGLGVIQLTPFANHVYKDVKTPLRDLLPLSKCETQLTEKAGHSEVALDVASEIPLRSVEIVKNQRSIWNYNPEEKVQPGELVYELAYESFGSAKKVVPEMLITLENGVFGSASSPMESWGIQRYSLSRQDGRLLILNRAEASIRNFKFSVIPAGKPEDCRVTMTLGGKKFTRSLPELEGMGLCVTEFNHASMFQIRRGLYAMEQPPHYALKEIKATAILPRVRPGEQWELRLVGAQGEVYRKLIHASGDDGRRVTVSEVAEATDRGIKVTVPALAAADLVYDFNGKEGYMNANGFADPEISAMLGGSCAYGGVAKAGKFPDPEAAGAPQWRTENGKNYLHFDGNGKYFVIPAPAVPYRVFRFRFTFRPEKAEKQNLFALQGQNYGSIHACTINADGSVTLILFGKYKRNVKFTSTPGIRFGQWNDFDLSYDGETLTLKLNGKTVLSKQQSGITGLRPHPLCFGGWEKGVPYFRGDLASFSIGLPSAK